MCGWSECLCIKKKLLGLKNAENPVTGEHVSHTEHQQARKTDRHVFFSFFLFAGTSTRCKQRLDLRPDSVLLCGPTRG